MPISLTCRCKSAFEVPDKLAGNTTMCPGCGAFLDVPEPGKQAPVIEDWRSKQSPKSEERRSRQAPTRDDHRAERDKEEPEELSRRDVIELVRDALDGDIKPVRRTGGYHFGVACVAIAMLFLPALYVGIIIGLALLMFWHAT